MEKKEKTNNDNKWWGSSDDKQKMAEMMANCCQGMNWVGDCRSVMGECMKGCRWFPLIPVILGILLLLLGYYLDAEITRILWMIAAGFLILMGAFALLMMSRMNRIWRSVE
jgi:hypothetical protein